MSRGRLALAIGLAALHAWLLLGHRVVPWHDALLAPLVLAVALAPLLAGGRRGAAFLVASAFLAEGLAYVWMVGFAGRNHVFAGVFALSDAQEYWADAARVLHGAPMISGGARRPLYSAVLAGLLALDGNGIRLAHVITLLFWAGAGVFAAGEVRRTSGGRAATLLLVVYILYARRYVGFVQSEGLGVPLGAVAFGLSWRARSLAEGWRATFLGGLAVQTVAVLARPGPMLVVVALALWAVRRERPGERRTLALLALGVMGGVFGLHALLRATTSGLASFSDALAIFYGLLHGEDSHFLFAREPWIRDPPDPAQTGLVLRLFARELAERPYLLVVAPLRCAASWLALPQGFFGFVWSNPDDRVLADGTAVRAAIGADGPVIGPILLWVRTLGVYSLANAVGMAIAAAAFVIALVRALVRRLWRRGPDDLVLHVIVGILLQLPLLPPWITEGAQILGSVVLWPVALVALSLFETTPEETAAPAALPRTGPLVLAAVVALVLAARLAPVRLGAACGEGGVLVDVDRGSVVALGPDDPRVGDRRANLALVARNNPRFAEELAPALTAPSRLYAAYDACHERLVYVREDGQAAGPPARRVWRALRPSRDPVLDLAITPTPTP